MGLQQLVSRRPDLSETNPLRLVAGNRFKVKHEYIIDSHGCTGCTGFFLETDGLKSWASVLLQEKRLHLSQGLSKRMSRPTGTPVALPELPKGCRSTFREFARRIPPSAPSGQHHPGARASRPHAVPWIAAQLSCDVAARPSCRREPHGPGRSRALAPLPVDPGGGDGRGCGKNCAGGTPALPGGFIP